jgi:hypothetical protein
MTPEQLEAGYWRAYREFYRWSAIAQGAMHKETWLARARHLAYAAGWKKFEPLWDFMIRAKRVAQMRPVLERVLSPVEKAGQEACASRTSIATGLWQFARGLRVFRGACLPACAPTGGRLVGRSSTLALPRSRRH